MIGVKRPSIVRVKCYDAGGDVLDRYVVFFSRSTRKWCSSSVAMSSNPYHPQGFWCSAGNSTIGKHLGKRVAFSELPEACQRAVGQYLATNLATNLASAAYRPPHIIDACGIQRFCVGRTDRRPVYGNKRRRWFATKDQAEQFLETLPEADVAAGRYYIDER